jgi:N,N'-diacetyllegionaminate synthase
MKSFFKKLKKTYIIAEIGVNHNNNISLAKKLVDKAKSAGADAVKFQTFKAKNLVLPGTRKVKYQLRNKLDKEDHYQMIKKLELSYSDHKVIYNYCKKKKIDFLSTPYDVESAKFLKKLGVKIFKTASADLIDYNLHYYLAKIKKPVIISTGMSSIKDIKKTLNLYKKLKNLNISLLHCVSNYPCSYKSINLNAIHSLKKLKFVVGYSDHSNDNLASCLAVGAGSKIIEKHFTLNKNLKGPDHKASCDPKELKSLVNKIRKAELIMGKKTKKIQTEELEMSKISKKSLYFRKSKKKRLEIKSSDLVALRPGVGLSPFLIHKFIGKKLKRNVLKHELLTFKHI